jgi:hypothetical protein
MNGFSVFSIDGLFYKTLTNIPITSEAQAKALIESGRAIQQFESYQAQFPWLYDGDALMTSPGVGNPNGVTLVTENGVDLWA